MDKNYRLAHLLGPTLRNRRIELGISEETIFQKTHLNISMIEKSSELSYYELIHLCKHYQWSLVQLYTAMDELDRSQKQA